MNTAKEKFRLFAERLRDCPTLDTSINPKLLCEIWSAFRTINPEHGDDVTAAMLLGLILFDEESFGALLSEAELSQLAALGCSALDRYRLKTNPMNQVGTLLAASLEDPT
jgi:hypothetical protein